MGARDADFAGGVQPGGDTINMKHEHPMVCRLHLAISVVSFGPLICDYGIPYS